MDGIVEKKGHILFVSRSITIKTHTPFFVWRSREKIYGDTLPWSLWYRLRLQEPQESVPLYLVLLTHEARLHNTQQRRLACPASSTPAFARHGL